MAARPNCEFAKQCFAKRLTMKKLIGIFGASGFARETADIAYELGYTPIFITSDCKEVEAWDFPEEIILDSKIDSIKKMVFSIGIGDNNVRKKIAQCYRESLNFINLIHPHATFGRGQLDLLKGKNGLIICSGVRLTNNINLGAFTILNLNATVGHDVYIGDFANIAPGASISGNVTIGPGCWIGTGAVINQGLPGAKLIVGENTTIGSGSVVISACSPDSIYVGVPAKRIK